MLTPDQLHFAISCAHGMEAIIVDNSFLVNVELTAIVGAKVKRIDAGIVDDQESVPAHGKMFRFNEASPLSFSLGIDNLAYTPHHVGTTAAQVWTFAALLKVEHLLNHARL